MRKYLTIAALSLIGSCALVGCSGSSNSSTSSSGITPPATAANGMAVKSGGQPQTPKVLPAPPP